MEHKNKEPKLKPITITDQAALRLLRKRADKEYRSMAGAAAVTIIEALSKNKKDGEDGTGKSSKNQR